MNKHTRNEILLYAIKAIANEGHDYICNAIVCARNEDYSTDQKQEVETWFHEHYDEAREATLEAGLFNYWADSIEYAWWDVHSARAAKEYAKLREVKVRFLRSLIQ